MRPDNKNTGKDVEMPHTRTPMTERMECLNGQGYTEDFTITEEGLKSIRTGDVFKPDNVKIIEHLRFEGITNPDDMAIMYVIETNTGLKGTVVGPFGVYADSDMIEFMNQVEDKTVDNIAKATLKECCSGRS